ncbi:hypothetical protein F2P81_000081 [Scophthalmus maximus]|uniref:Uncharacterized protein n=1 Tax=Scophthalmus maximus TaxID=52904 RepID=A0A6A4TQ25_SCOMX|nr:hypothetical protein F2P81_000081 [Scophthalmus maximus]
MRLCASASDVLDRADRDPERTRASASSRCGLRAERLRTDTERICAAEPEERSDPETCTRSSSFHRSGPGGPQRAGAEQQVPEEDEPPEEESSPPSEAGGDGVDPGGGGAPACQSQDPREGVAGLRSAEFKSDPLTKNFDVHSFDDLDFTSSPQSDTEFWDKMQAEWEELARRNWLEESEGQRPIPPPVSPVEKSYFFNTNNPYSERPNVFAQGQEKARDGDLNAAVLLLEAAILQDPQDSEVTSDHLILGVIKP